jgi:DNA-binding IclR family transcriptional regulator
VCIDKVDSTEPIRVTYDIGQSGPLYAGSSGKALLAFLDPTEQEQVLNEIEFVAFTPLTVTDRRELERNLASVRGQGYAHTFGELDNGVQAVGAPIWNHLNRLEGGVTLVGPATRWTTERVPAFVQATVASAARISSLLGHRELPAEFAAEPALPV